MVYERSYAETQIILENKREKKRGKVKPRKCCTSQIINDARVDSCKHFKDREQ